MEEAEEAEGAEGAEEAEAFVVLLAGGDGGFRSALSGGGDFLSSGGHFIKFN